MLLSVVQYDGDMQMPPKGKLSAAEIAEFTAWVKHGAPMPKSADAAERMDGEIDFAAGRKFWSFQPAVVQTVPAVKDDNWPRSRIDSFVLAALEREGLKPSPQADRAVLIRRLSFDLLGLPPTPEQVQAFVADESSDAYKKLVEQLLASPHYGEQWGRMWLDLARYTDKTASWLYATGQAHVADEWEERVDATTRTFLGLTVACARCHDHKFDPIFASCRQVERPVIAEADYEPVKTAKAEVAKLESEIAKLKKQKPVPKEKIDQRTAKTNEIKSSTPLYDTPMANVVTEESMHVVRAGKTPQDGTKLDYRPEPW